MKFKISSDERVNYLWSYLTDLNKQQIVDFESQLKSLPEQNIYDCIQTIEKLHIKLLVEYNIEVSRGKAIGIIKQWGTLFSSTCPAYPSHSFRDQVKEYFP